MRYLCTKQFTAGGETYYPGEMIPDGVILPERSGKLLRSGYISEVSEESWQTPVTGTVIITIKGDRDEEYVDIPATPEEIQQAFSILQMNTEEGIKAISDVKSEHVLIIVHSIGNRKTIKEAAKKQADNLFPTDSIKNDPSNGKQSTGTNTEGSDT